MSTALFTWFKTVITNIFNKKQILLDEAQLEDGSLIL